MLPFTHHAFHTSTDDGSGSEAQIGSSGRNNGVCRVLRTCHERPHSCFASRRRHSALSPGAEAWWVSRQHVQCSGACFYIEFSGKSWQGEAKSWPADAGLSVCMYMCWSCMPVRDFTPCMLDKKMSSTGINTAHRHAQHHTHTHTHKHTRRWNQELMQPQNRRSLILPLKILFLLSGFFMNVWIC